MMLLLIFKPSLEMPFDKRKKQIQKRQTTNIQLLYKAMNICSLTLPNSSCSTLLTSLYQLFWIWLKRKAARNTHHSVDPIRLFGFWFFGALALSINGVVPFA